MALPYLPHPYVFRGRTYEMHFEMKDGQEIDREYRRYPSHIEQDCEKLRRKGYLTRVVRVLSPKLKGRTDLHGREYQPSVFIFKCKKQKNADISSADVSAKANS